MDLDQLHALSIGVRWPHRARDWQLLRELGQGFAAVDEIGRVAGSVTWLRYGPDLVMVGMLITAPRLQENGAGRWLMTELHRRNPGRRFALTGTRAALRLYRDLGYGHEQRVLQCQGEATPPADPAPPEGVLRPLSPDDLPALARLDEQAMGCDRMRVLARLLPESEGVALLRDGDIAAFSLCRRFGRGRVMGPVIAARDADAIAVTLPHVRAHAGEFLRADTPEPDSGFARLLVGCGLPVYDIVTGMSRPDPAYRPRRPGGPRRYALISQALG